MNRFRKPRRVGRLHLLGLAACAAALLMPTLAGAQDGPQFGNWGPGMAPPDQEGPDLTAPSMAPGGAYSAPAPYGPPVPFGGCSHDLRGNWWNSGRQTTGGSRSYTASVYVRQYRSWIQAQQDDGTGYYGQCVGSRLQLDIYSGYQYVGRQYGTITSGSWLTPLPLYDDWILPYAAPSAPSPVRRGIQANFTWTTWFGSGAETWYRTSLGPPVVIDPWPLGGPISVPTPLPTAMPTAIPTPTQSRQTVRIDSILPVRGPAGSEVVVNGSGFTADENLVTFGASSSLRRPDGTPANLASRAGSADSRTLRFTVPWSSPSGTLCDDSGNCVNITATLLQPGSYDVAVANANGTSNSVPFEMTSNSGTPVR